MTLDDRPKFRLASVIVVCAIVSTCNGEITEHTCIQIDTTNHHVILRDYQYERYRIFDVGVTGDSVYWALGDSIISFHLFQATGDIFYEQRVAYPDVRHRAAPDSVTQRFRELSYGEDYVLQRGKFFLLFLNQIPNIQSTVIAYSMALRRANSDDTLMFGTLEGGKYQLQMLKQANSLPSDPLRNVEW